MEVETLQVESDLALNAPIIISTLLKDSSAVTDYRALRDSLPARLAVLLGCRCVLLYQQSGDTLQFAAGWYDNVPGWSSALLAVARINPIDLTGDLPEARAWRLRRVATDPPDNDAPGLVAAPLMYRQRAIGVMVAVRGLDPPSSSIVTGVAVWAAADLPAIEAVAGTVALLLENTRLLERDRERIHELSLLNTIAGQLHYAMYDRERIHSNITQRAREIANADTCELLLPQTPPNDASWIPPALRDRLFDHFLAQRGSQIAPLIVERAGDGTAEEYVGYLPDRIKTFFALPLFVSETTRQVFAHDIDRIGAAPHAIPQQMFAQTRGVSDSSSHGTLSYTKHAPGLRLHGLIVGAYHRAWKLHREEVVMLQILANQASAVLENSRLMTDVIEARNEARKLLRQVLDDQRIKETILQSVPGGLISVDLDERVTTFNRAAGSILGSDAREAIGQPLRTILSLPDPLASLFPEESRSTIHAIAPRTYNEAPVGDAAALETTEKLRGQELILDLHAVPLLDDQGRRIGTLLAFNDITAIHRLEEEKRRLDRLATLGEMAANVAHEVRNPLASIKISMQMLQEDLGSEQPDLVEARESVAIAQHEVERLDAIVRELLLFSRERQLHRMPCDLPALCDHVLQLLSPQCQEANVTVHRIYHELPPLAVDVAQIEQALLNLCANALQAMPNGGTLTVSCRPDDGEGAEQSEERAASHPHWVELAVSDTGGGIAPDHLDRIFQPFFTTKAHGIGLGLSITRRLVEDHGGMLRVASFLGYGSTFAIRLPFAVEQADEEDQGA